MAARRLIELTMVRRKFCRLPGSGELRIDFGFDRRDDQERS